jgi:hypothetical protein
MYRIIMKKIAELFIEIKAQLDKNKGKAEEERKIKFAAFKQSVKQPRRAITRTKHH